MSILVPNSLKAWLILALIALIATNINLQFPCLTAIKKDLATTEFMIQLSLTLGPALAIISNLFFGTWCDRFKRKTLLIYCVILFLTGSFICAISDDILPFLIGRALQILGDAGVSIIGFAILSTLCKDEKLGEYLGYNTILTTLFCICSPPIGAWLGTYYSWRISFVLLAVLTTILLVLISLILPNDKIITDSAPISFKNLLKEYYSQIKLPIFLLAVVIPALCTTITSLFDFYSPVFYMEIYGISSQHFSYIKVFLIAISVIASFLYILILKNKGMKLTFTIGIFWHILYTIAILATLITSNYHHPIILFILAGIQGVSGAFINPIGMFKAIVSFPKKEGISLSIFALARNIISAGVTFGAALVFNDNMFPIILIIGVIAVTLSGLLFAMYKKL